MRQVARHLSDPERKVSSVFLDDELAASNARRRRCYFSLRASEFAHGESLSRAAISGAKIGFHGTPFQPPIAGV